MTRKLQVFLYRHGGDLRLRFLLHNMPCNTSLFFDFIVIHHLLYCCILLIWLWRPIRLNDVLLTLPCTIYRLASTCSYFLKGNFFCLTHSFVHILYTYTFMLCDVCNLMFFQIANRFWL